MTIRRFSLSPNFALVLLSMAWGSALAQQVPAPRDQEAATRATREASNPMRVIIEASKLKARTTEAPVPEKRPVRTPVAAKSAASAVPVATAAAPATAAKPASVPAPAPAPAETVLAAAPQSSQLALPAPVVPEPPKPLKLTRMVEPSLPAAVWRRMRNDAEVVVGFTVNADGSVSDVAVRSTPIKALEDPVLDAIRQWRYEPIREPRTHQVQLVLRTAQ